MIKKFFVPILVVGGFLLSTLAILAFVILSVPSSETLQRATTIEAAFPEQPLKGELAPLFDDQNKLRLLNCGMCLPSKIDSKSCLDEMLVTISRVWAKQGDPGKFAFPIKWFTGEQIFRRRLDSMRAMEIACALFTSRLTQDGIEGACRVVHGRSCSSLTDVEIVNLGKALKVGKLSLTKGLPNTSQDDADACKLN